VSGLRAAIAGAGRVVVASLHEDDLGARLGAAAVTDGTTVTGVKTFVDSGTHAEVLLVPATLAGSPSLVVVDAAGDGVTVETMPAIDPGRGLASVALDSASAAVVASGARVVDAMHDAWLVGALLSAADAAGTADRCLELARGYAVEREQFGRPVASFQSVKHKLVDMYAELETARSVVRAALVAAAEGAPEWRWAASAAKARAGDAVMHVARECVQVHGGIGFTWEHEASHHFRRATTLRALYGTPTAHRELVATHHGF
jgi:alkylation response protein AidB-like acyl-CoA dehydrogenase